MYFSQCKLHRDLNILLYACWQICQYALYERPTRPISWLKAARREFEKFPEEAQATMMRALTIAAEGGKADIAKPFKGVNGGAFEIALKHRGDALRVIYAVQLGPDVIGVDAFQKKSKSGIKTPQMDVDRIKERIKRLKESL
jgi:phage-related protein